MFTVMRGFHRSTLAHIKLNKLPPRPKVPESEIEEVFIKGGGNGGQKINKTNSKVQLRHVLTGLVVSSQATRSREQNRKKARELLALKIQHISDPENSRLKVLQDRKVLLKSSKQKKTKKKYKDLQEKKDQQEKTEDEPPVLIRFE